MDVSEDMKIERARQIAALLNDPEKWRSHGRAIDMVKLQGREVGLKIDNLLECPDLYSYVRDYFELLKDYMNRQQLISFVHSREYF
ncbi:MAG: hypothetical protein F4014_01025 [Gemmatimonadetes bacterium]|nr:hypothetical protein [Gemmatimonadota bacterium]